MKTIKNFIDGEFCESSSKEFFTKDDPATGKQFLKVPCSNARDAEAAIEAARKAAKQWALVPLEKRCLALSLIADKIQERFEDFAKAECEDTGKPIALCRELDIPRAILNFRFYADFAQKLPAQEDFNSEAATNYAIRKPLGVVTLITPWNLPIYLLTWKLAPALAMGNAAICKPSELTPQTANLLAEVITACGLPKGLVNIIHGPGKDAAEPLIGSPHVKAVSFTGGTVTGRRVAEVAAREFKKVSLELGGKNPTLVFEDSDLKKAAVGVARSSFLNQGQICLCGERIFIQKSIYKEFTNLLIEETKKLKAGVPSNPETNYGTLISKSHLEKVNSYVELAKNEGGKILLGGKRFSNFDGFFYEPTIIDGLSSTCRTAQEEIFGPVVTLHSFDSEEDAIEQANNVEYGLSASCWTKDQRRAQRLGEKIDAGTVWINTWLLRDLRVPFGGMKKSGLGREGGRHSLEFFSEYKTVSIKKD